MIENVFVPATSAALAGQRRVRVGGRDADRVGRADEFQLASTALTVTLNEPPAVCAVGVPVLPVAVPGAAVSPGSRIWSFANAPALIVVDGLVFAVFAPLRDVGRGEGRRAGRLRRDREGLRAGDERGVGGQRGVRVGRGDADRVGRA